MMKKLVNCFVMKIGAWVWNGLNERKWRKYTNDNFKKIWAHFNVIKPFYATCLFLYPQKTSKNLWFPSVFNGYRQRSVAWNRSIVAIRIIFKKIISKRTWIILTHFMSLVSFYTHWKHQKISYFLIFSGVEKEASGLKWVHST